MDIREYIDSLFDSYEETDALSDFKEELQSNLNERIANLIRKGMGDKAAFEKAVAELGDISELADQISRKKRQEVFEDMYMKTRNYMTPVRVGLYVLCGTVLGFGMITALLSWFYGRTPMAPIGTMLVFGLASIMGFVFLGLTQETAVHEAMSRKRALLYTITSGVFLFGVDVFILTYFNKGTGLPQAVGTLIPFVLPSLAFGIFLILTEKDRSKTWVIEKRQEAIRKQMEYFASPAHEAKFGILSGAIWIAAIALFILLTITVGIKFSWLSVAAALVGEMILLACFTVKK